MLALPTAATSARTPGVDFGSQKLAVGLFSHGKDAVADFKVFQCDRLTFLIEGRLVIDHDHSLAVATAHNGDLVAFDGFNFAARVRALHPSAATGSPAATTRAASAALTRSTWPATALEALELLFGDPVHSSSDELLIAIRSPTDKDVVADFQVFQSQLFRLLLTFYSLAVVSLVIHHDGLRRAIGLLDFEPVDSHRGNRAENRRRPIHRAMVLPLILRRWGILRNHAAGYAKGE